MIQLLITMGEDRREVLLEDGDPVTIGRSPENALQLPEPKLSRRHARIEWDELGFLLKDLHSSNGTWLNRRRIASDRLLQGDEIRLGGVTIQVLKLGSPVTRSIPAS